MKWLKSTTQKTWTVNGKVIPACVTPHSDYLKIDDSEFTKISGTPVVKSLISAGAILVLSEEPAELKNSVDALQGNNAALMAQVTQLQEQLKAKEAELKAASAKKSTKVDIEKIKEEAQAEIKEQAIRELEEKEARIAELEAQLAAKSE